MTTISVDQKPILTIGTPPQQGFGRIRVVRNKGYKHDGLKSYGHALLKYNFAPTKDGPFYVGDRFRSPGVFGVGRFRVQLPGKDKVDEPQHILMKRRETKSDIHHLFSHVTGEEIVDGEVQAMDIQHDSLYLCPVICGSPGKTFLLDFDTGSADTWLWSMQLPESTLHHYGKRHAIYDHNESSSYRPKPDFTWKIQYGDGSTASGNVCHDRLVLGGLRIEDQAIERAQHLSPSFESNVSDGLLGLAFTKINTGQPHPLMTPVERMMKQDDIHKSAQLFTAHLTSWREEGHENESFYTFGYIDQDVLHQSGLSSEKDIWYTPVDSDQGFWQFSSSAASVNGQRLEYPKLSSAIADTGTTLALVSDEICQAIYRQIPGAEYDRRVQGYTFPSNITLDQLPVVEFDVGGKMFAVKKADLAFADAGHGRSYGGIQSRGDLPFDILGDTWLKSVYAIFDLGNKRFGAVPRISHV